MDELRKIMYYVRVAYPRTEFEPAVSRIHVTLLWKQMLMESNV